MASTSTPRPCSDDDSDSSSIIYKHEPFVTFRSRVLALAVTSIWPGSVPDEITIERMRGGGYSRITGLTQHNSQTDTKTRYILRIPRFDAAHIESEIASVQFLRQYTNIPAPEVVAFDETDQNALGSPYAAQIRVDGTDLHSSFPKLNHIQRCRVARELGSVYRQMLAVRSSVAGRLAFSNKHKRLSAPLYVAHLRLMDAQPPTPYTDSPMTESVHELLTANFQAQKAIRLKWWSTELLTPKFLDRFCDMASELEADGWFADTHYSLAHLDLAPRNILINPTLDVQTPVISAVLDCDNAVLAPMFMSCAPPMWIWAWNDDEDEDERTANDEPPTQEGVQLKLTFEEAAGPDYLRFAYKPAYRLARRLLRFAIDGMRSNEDFEEAEAMLQEWICIRQARTKGQDQ
ncbi:phosphotransferase enzyme family-domain-containing protein [Ilyonectria robusta]|uniref:phosphotransferase enzyme family-domain-containing protein n=1 Tax=Ilyonectria robusta TaxID=1079257 RepID=UPI001E8D8A49|nr:phosphotransferase enzyme family-domain-containing protein [Ilyonectria robusta]KAH8736182.1 phosphotransferase enzyme family-domain-containing protein [Ilyonectria robusta]